MNSFRLTKLRSAIATVIFAIVLGVLALTLGKLVVIVTVAWALLSLLELALVKYHIITPTIFRSAVATSLFVAIWLIFTLTLDGISLVGLVGWAMLYLIGLAWLQFFVEYAGSRIETRRIIRNEPTTRRGWNPLDPGAVYYSFLVSLICFVIFVSTAAAALGIPLAQGAALSSEGKALAVAAGVLAMASLAAAAAQSKKLRQSLAMLASYSIVFVLVYFLIHWQFNKNDGNEYELPAGGGSDSIKASSVKVQKVIRKKFVVNPYSNIVFAAPPPIDQIELKLNEETANQYKAGKGDGGLGDGEGEGGGFGAGTGKGKIRFIRLRHSDKNWDKNFGVNGDRNLLVEYVVREPKAKGKVADETEAIDIATLGTFPHKKSPPMVYVGGSGTFAPSAADKKVLKQYLTEKHGMIIGDNLGGPGFHNAFVAVMNEVTGVTPVAIPRDDRIHQRPYELPQIPILVTHGGSAALGWKIDGRWAVYYHPGALSDIWATPSATQKKDIIELSYQLGINLIYYSHREYSQWLQSQQP